MDKSWQSVRKSCKNRFRTENQKEEAPCLNLDAIKLDLKCPVKIRGRSGERELNQWNICRDGSLLSQMERDDVNKYDVMHMDRMKQDTPNGEENLRCSLEFTNILTVSAVSHSDEARLDSRKTYVKKAVDLDFKPKTGIYNKSKPQEKISPRKIYLGGGFYTAIAIYDKNANIDIVKIGETRLGLMNFVINRKKTIVEKRRNTCLPKLHDTCRIDGAGYMPEELKCGKISDRVVWKRTVSKVSSSCRVCEQTKKKSRSNIGPKQIKLFLSIDV